MMETLSNKDIKLIRSLREKKYRDELGMFTVEGEKMVAEATASGFDIVMTVRRDEVGEALMERISACSSPSPVLAVVRKPSPASRPASGLCLALDSVRDPGNMGTILRLADWFGVDCIFASPDSVEVYNPKVVQASMGAIFRKKLIYCDIAVKCEEFRSAGLDVFGTFLNGEDIYKTDLPAEGLIVMGNEANGISEAVASVCSRRLTIPSFGGGAESLNVSLAAAIVVSEFKRWK
jgi:TrmH family RNA methyltransferase